MSNAAVLAGHEVERAPDAPPTRGDRMSLDTIAHASAPRPSLDPPPRAARAAPVVVATGGLAWNTFGVLQFLQTLASTPESLRHMGMTAEQAEAYASYPAWMTFAFAVGVGGGLGGSLLLLAGRRQAVPVLAASLIGYLLLYAGDITEGVFAALGWPQVAILTAVVAIAACLLVWARRLDRTGALR
jgi:hypothetical protein